MAFQRLNMGRDGLVFGVGFLPSTLSVGGKGSCVSEAFLPFDWISWMTISDGKTRNYLGNIPAASNTSFCCLTASVVINVTYSSSKYVMQLESSKDL